MRSIEKARLADERAARMIAILKAGGKLIARIGPSNLMELICWDSSNDPYDSNKVYDDFVLNCGSAGSEFVSEHEFRLGEIRLRKSLAKRPSSETRAKLENEWKARALEAAMKTSEPDKLQFAGKYGIVVFCPNPAHCNGGSQKLFVVDVPEARQWVKYEQRHRKLRGIPGYKEVVFVA